MFVELHFGWVAFIAGNLGFVMVMMIVSATIAIYTAGFLDLHRCVMEHVSAMWLTITKENDRNELKNRTLLQHNIEPSHSKNETLVHQIVHCVWEELASV